MHKIVRIKVPATTANLGPGFDVLGAAVTLYNEIEVCYDPREMVPGLHCPPVVIDGEGKDRLPRGARNAVWQAIITVLKSRKQRQFPRITAIKLTNAIPLASGLGSSAAARLGGILAADTIGSLRLPPEEILSFGVRLEGHPDNIVPAFAGGLCVSCLEANAVRYVKLPSPRLKAVVCNPDFELATEEARRVLPKQVTLQTAIFNSSRLAMLLAAFQCRRYQLLSMAMEDRLHQPARAHLIPGMVEVLAAARGAGAFGAALSGAGPSIIALAAPAAAARTGRAMQEKWRQFNIDSRYFVLGFDARGAQVSRGA